MAFGANVSNCDRLESYEDCVELFTTPANLRRQGWGPDKRPLDDLRKTHMRVERGDGYYDVVLYSTAMARYFKPEGNTREVWYNCDSRNTTTDFNYRVLRVSEHGVSERTTDGRRVKVGFNKHASGLFPIRLHYVDGKLDTSKSQDAPCKLPSTTSTERKQDRRDFKKWLRPYIAMAEIMPEARANYYYVHDVKAAFKEDRALDPDMFVGCINAKGGAWVVDRVYPLGDVENYEESFKEIV